MWAPRKGDHERIHGFSVCPLCEHRSEGKSQTSLPSSNMVTPPHPHSPAHPKPGTQTDGTMKQGERDNRKQNLKVDFRADQLWWMFMYGNLFSVESNFRNKGASRMFATFRWNWREMLNNLHLILKTEANAYRLHVSSIKMASTQMSSEHLDAKWWLTEHSPDQVWIQFKPGPCPERRGLA